MLDCFDHIPATLTNLMLCGGGARSSLWCQIVSDVTGKTVNIPGGSEFGALGAAIISGLATGIYPDIGEAVKRTVSLEATFQPNMENHQKYRELYRLYQGLYQHLWDDWDTRAEILNQMVPQAEP